MAVHVLQAVLREAEAVAHCHRVQVGAKREQVCMSGLQTSGGVQWWKCYLKKTNKSKKCHATPVIVFSLCSFKHSWCLFHVIHVYFPVQVDTRKEADTFSRHVDSSLLVLGRSFKCLKYQRNICNV